MKILTILILSLVISTCSAVTRDGKPIHKAGKTYQNHLELGTADPDALRTGSFDSWRIYYSSAMGDTYSGPNNGYYPVIRLVEKRPFRPWRVQNQPALSAGTGWDSLKVETPCVVKDNTATPSKRYRMYYSGASEWHPQGFPKYSIGLAISQDGKTFSRVGEVLKIEDVFPGLSGVVADPEVLIKDGIAHMWFSSYAHDADYNVSAYGIAYAYSIDGETWIPVGVMFPGASQPSLTIGADGRYEMYFTRHMGNELNSIPSISNVTMGVWRSKSIDLINWQEDAIRPFIWSMFAPYENLGVMTGVDVVYANGKTHFFYTAWSNINPPPDYYVPVHGGYVPGVNTLLHAAE